MSENIENFIKETFTPYQKQVLEIAPIDAVIYRMLEEIGVDPTGFHHAVDRYGLLHALKEHSLDELPLSVEDFKKIPEIVISYDSVVRSHKTGLQLDSLLYSKRFNGSVYYLEEIRTGRKELIFKTMYKKRTEPGASTADHP